VELIFFSGRGWESWTWRPSPLSLTACRSWSTTTLRSLRRGAADGDGEPTVAGVAVQRRPAAGTWAVYGGASKIQAVLVLMGGRER
jgi:hypothetical protein